MAQPVRRMRAADVVDTDIIEDILDDPGSTVDNVLVDLLTVRGFTVETDEQWGKRGVRMFHPTHWRYARDASWDDGTPVIHSAELGCAFVPVTAEARKLAEQYSSKGPMI
jgi:hypothetical protein